MLVVVYWVVLVVVSCLDYEIWLEILIVVVLLMFLLLYLVKCVVVVGLVLFEFYGC